MLDAQAIAMAARPTRIPYACRCFDEIDSTNEEVKRRIEKGEPEGTVATALVQTGGYGRQGRRWASPAGSLYLSLLLRPLDHGVAAKDLPTLSLAVALAVHDVLASFSDDAGVVVKWPNDVLCSQGKLCGISLEAVRQAVCIGIGINVFEPAEVPELTGSFGPAYLERIADLSVLHRFKGEDACSDALPFGGKRACAAAFDDAGRLSVGACSVLEDVAGRLLASVDRLYAQWLHGGFAALVDEYNAHAYLTGRSVGIALMNGDVVARGEVVRTDERGCLVLRDAGGAECAIASGEAHVVL